MVSSLPFHSLSSPFPPSLAAYLVDKHIWEKPEGASDAELALQQSSALDEEEAGNSGHLEEDGCDHDHDHDGEGGAGGAAGAGAEGGASSPAGTGAATPNSGSTVTRRPASGKLGPQVGKQPSLAKLGQLGGFSALVNHPHTLYIAPNYHTALLAAGMAVPVALPSQEGGAAVVAPTGNGREGAGGGGEGGAGHSHDHGHTASGTAAAAGVQGHIRSHPSLPPQYYSLRPGQHPTAPSPGTPPPALGGAEAGITSSGLGGALSPTYAAAAAGALHRTGIPTGAAAAAVTWPAEHLPHPSVVAVVPAGGAGMQVAVGGGKGPQRRARPDSGNDSGSGSGAGAVPVAAAAVVTVLPAAAGGQSSPHVGTDV